MEFVGDEVFEEMMRRLNKSTLKEDDYEYIENEDEMWAEVARLEHGYFVEGLEQGRAEGRMEGRMEGRAEGQLAGKRETARKMLAKGFSIDEVSELTGLSGDELTN